MVQIDEPSEGAVFAIPVGEHQIDVSIEGTATAVEGPVAKDTTLIYALDISESMTAPALADCDGDGIADPLSFADSKFSCAVRALKSTNEAASLPDSRIGHIGLVTFSDGASALDLDLGAAGDQLLVQPSADGDGDGVPDFAQVMDEFLLSAPLGDTNSVAALNAAMDLLETAPDPWDSGSYDRFGFILFVSDGGPTVGDPISSAVEPPTIPPHCPGWQCSVADVVIRAVAVQGTCLSNTDLGSLQDLAELSNGGHCTAITGFALNFADFFIAELGIMLEPPLTVTNNAVPIVGDVATDPPLRLWGSGSVSFAVTETLGPGSHTVCATARGSDVTGAADATACTTISVAYSVESGKIVVAERECSSSIDEVCGGGRLATLEPDGSGFTPIGQGSQPTWSPDGSQIAFVLVEWCTVRGNPLDYPVNVLAVMDADGSNVVRLTEGVGGPADEGLCESSDGWPTHPSWSPDGETLVFFWERFDGPKPTGVYTIPVDGSEPPTLVETGYGRNPVWSPDGTQIAHIQGGIFTEGIRIATVGGPGGRLIDPTGILVTGYHGELEWLPDNRLAFLGRDTDTCTGPLTYHPSCHGLYTVNPDGTRLTLIAEEVADFAWSPDGTEIVYRPPDDELLYMMNADGSQASSLGGVVGHDPDWQALPTSSPPASVINDLLSLVGRPATTYDATPVDGAPAGVFAIASTFENTSSSSITSASFEVTTLTGGNLVLNADGEPAGEGAIVFVPDDALGGDGVLSPGESFTVDFEVGLQQRRRFTFRVAALGVVQD